MLKRELLGGVILGMVIMAILVLREAGQSVIWSVLVLFGGVLSIAKVGALSRWTQRRDQNTR